MIVVPREKPVIESINSYYVDIDRFIEHYQGEVGCGAIYFKAASAEAILFFEEQELLGATFEVGGKFTDGPEGIRQLMSALPKHNFTISVYRIDADKVYFWTNLPRAEDLYRDLSSEFSDLASLLKKMEVEKLTGYIEVIIGDGSESGLIFFYNGTILGSSCSWDGCSGDDSIEKHRVLIEKTRESGGVFHVKRVSLNRASEPDAAPAATADSAPPIAMELIQELLLVCEKTVNRQHGIKADFGTLLKRKFLQNAEMYDFLDPFAAEFQYSNGRASFHGRASDDELVRGIVNNLRELAQELDIWPQLARNLTPWFAKYRRSLTRLRIVL
jgi:hypothetical protein